jgi:ELWxxDGT repeat protein
MVKDINLTGDGAPYDFIAINSELYFTADDGTHGHELWKSDGTSGGTTMVKDINLSGDSNFQSPMAIGTTLYFEADDGVHGTELWKSDGTSGGTTMAKDINLTGNGIQSGLTIAGGKLYFAADDGVHGTELWKSDGTSDGTAMVADINPSGSGSPVYLFNDAENKILYFRAQDGANNGDNGEPWILSYAEAPTPTPSAHKSSLVGGIHYGCKDPLATNYEQFSASNPALCKYPTSVVTTTKNLGIPGVCAPDQILTQNLKVGAHNGRYNSYTKGIVKEAKLLQRHMNRLGFSSGKEDGILGSISDGAIKQMQIFLGTKPDGMVGSITRGLINNSCGTK